MNRFFLKMGRRLTVVVWVDISYNTSRRPVEIKMAHVQCWRIFDQNTMLATFFVKTRSYDPLWCLSYKKGTKLKFWFSIFHRKTSELIWNYETPWTLIDLGSCQSPRAPQKVTRTFENIFFSISWACFNKPQERHTKINCCKVYIRTISISSESVRAGGRDVLIG